MEKIYHTDLLEIRVSESDSISSICEFFEKNIEQLSTQNIALNLDLTSNLKESDIDIFDQLKDFFDKNGCFFVLVSKKLNAAKLLEREAVVVPTIEEAKQYIEIEEMQKQLNL